VSDLTKVCFHPILYLYNIDINSSREQVGEEEDGIITAIPKDKAEELLEVIRNGMDRDREVYHHQQEQQPSQHFTNSPIKRWIRY
jgi:hypothetical protein